jgi:biotin-(acetyl-CoA carboxylase) ligase
MLRILTDWTGLYPALFNFNQPLNREALLQRIVQRIEQSLKQLKQEGLKPWIEDWRRMDQFIGHEARMVEEIL